MRERDCGRKDKALYFSALNGTFFLLFEQGALLFCFVPGPAKYVVDPTQVVHSLRFNWVGLKRVLISPDPLVACDRQADTHLCLL